MRAAWYEKQGPAKEVLVVGEMPDPHPGAGEVRIRIAASGINPGDVKKRRDAFGYGMPYPRVIPHSDGAGQVDEIGAGATDQATPSIPFWPMVFKTARVFFLGSDDFPQPAKLEAARALTDALAAGWPGFTISERVPLDQIGRAHELVEHPGKPGRIVLLV